MSVNWKPQWEWCIVQCGRIHGECQARGEKGEEDGGQGYGGECNEPEQDSRYEPDNGHNQMAKETHRIG